SRLRGALAPRLRPELAPTRVAYPALGAPRGRAVFLFLPTAQGYLWDFPRDTHHSVGVGVPPGTFARTPLDEAIAQYRLAETGEHGPVEQRGAVIATSQWVSGRFADLGGRDYALLGDAGGLADPATGEGIDYALRSATLAAEAFWPDRGFERYPAAVRRAFAAEMRRARWIRRWLYRPGLADVLVRRARRSPRWALLLMSLVDAINEHGSLRGALLRSLVSRAPDRRAAEAVCECPDGRGAVAPPPRGNEAAHTRPDPRCTGPNLRADFDISPDRLRSGLCFSDPRARRPEQMTTGTHTHDTHTCSTCGRKHEVGTTTQRLELQRIELSVAGLSCPGDAAPLAARLERLPGVREAMVNPVTERAVVAFDPGTIGIKAIIGVLEEWGIDVGRTVARWRLKVPGLKCASCVQRIEQAVEQVPGVYDASVNLATETLTVEYTPKRTDLAAVRAAVRAEGFDLG